LTAATPLRCQCKRTFAAADARPVFLKMNRKLVSAYNVLWTDLWTCGCVNLAHHNWRFGLFVNVSFLLVIIDVFNPYTN